MNNLDVSIALATAPSSAFARLRERPTFWFPLVLQIVVTAAIFYWYYSAVDLEWFKDLVFSNNPDLQKLPDDQRAQAMGMYTRGVLVWGSVVSIALFVPAFLLVQSLYLLLASKVTKMQVGFKHWFAFICWTSLPALLNFVVAAILLLLSDTTQMNPSTLQPLSLNELVFHRPMNAPGFTLLESLNLATLLSWVLMVIGVRNWSQRSWAFSATIIALPIVLIYGIWALLAFR